MPPQRPYSPYPPTANSPIQTSMQTSPGGMPLPPNKRQRLSPNPGIPGSPYPHTITSPYSPYASLPGTPVQAHAPLGFNQPQSPMDQGYNMPPQAPPPQGLMGPPQRPAEKEKKQEERPDKATDINDLSDVIGASGIDLREEENYLAQTYQNQHQNASFSSSFAQSPATLSPNNSFNALSQGSFGSYGAFQGSGPVSQPTVPQKTVEDELYEKHKAAARALSERSQRELNDPFLRGNCVRQKLGGRAYEHGVQINVEGLFDKLPDAPRGVNATQAKGPDGSGMVKAQAQALLDHSAPFAEILSLLSLATKERLRGVMEDSYALSRARQLGTHGTVPPDFSNIAVGHDASQPQSTTQVPSSVTKSSWDQPDSAISPTTVPVKRSLDSDAPKTDPRLPTPPTETPPSPQPTIAFSSTLVPTLKKIQQQERKWEQERVAKRQKRQKSISSDTPIDGKISPADLIAPTKMTKKERERIAKAGQTDEVLHKNANATANMAVGGFGKKYSWLSGGSSGASTPRINTAVGGNTGGGAVAAATNASSAQDRGLISRDRKWGEWREDGVKGQGIQIRDLVAALEADDRERKTLARALVRLKSDS
ncbi:uncharacterized protein K452DRAFT_225556 [Aplosporella prunicola CBS 121167]|uniref:Transcription initiation factor TFIID subunit 4 n=1 Tax=Aplosporella prunicola CBS 121167 TaxID=1176127 RepID=A0A6A6BKP8_9PEZI|nr:uncharacterized protein K452DRAFT_225556 [Aplosporella prunicola CBS 121167]KAF2143427.1 hypothetical protein K452DRAFT_225556 [Aplosporella prunicola CBS 121167]